MGVRLGLGAGWIDWEELASGADRDLMIEDVRAVMRSRIVEERCYVGGEVIDAYYTVCLRDGGAKVRYSGPQSGGWFRRKRRDIKEYRPWIRWLVQSGILVWRLIPAVSENCAEPIRARISRFDIADDQ